MNTHRYVMEIFLYANGSLGNLHYGAIITRAYPYRLGIISAESFTMRKVRFSLIFMYNHKFSVASTYLYLGGCGMQNHGLQIWSS